jgi:hypothetical protein
MVALEYERFYAAASVDTRSGAGKAKPHGESISVVADLPPSLSRANVVELNAATKSRERAAKVTGSSGRAVQQAKAVQRDTPDHFGDATHMGVLAARGTANRRTLPDRS